VPSVARQIGLLLVVGLLVHGSYQYYSYLVSKSTDRSYLATRFPNMHISFNDVTFDFKNRSINYTFSFLVMTGSYQGDYLQFTFNSQMAPGFSIFPKLGSPYGPRFYYQATKSDVFDQLYGISERDPYDFYRDTYDVHGYTESPLDFDRGFVPYVRAFMRYPQSLQWQIEAEATPFILENKDLWYYVDFKVTLTVTRVLGYSSLLNLIPLWAGNIVLASSLFLVDEKCGKKVPRITDRLTLYVSMFVLGFTYLTSQQVAMKWLLTGTEVFVMALLSSTAVFAAFSNLSKYTRSARSWDLYAVAFSIMSLILFVLVSPVLFLWHKIRTNDPWYRLSDLGWVLSWFLDWRLLPWVLLVSASYIVAYAKVYRSGKSSKLAIFLAGAFVYWLTSFEDLHDPVLLLISIGCMVFSGSLLRSSSRNTAFS